MRLSRRVHVVTAVVTAVSRGRVSGFGAIKGCR
jgi:hypothetical protein